MGIRYVKESREQARKFHRIEWMLYYNYIAWGYNCSYY
jgi:hypothetical protein